MPFELACRPGVPRPDLSLDRILCPTQSMAIGRHRRPGQVTEPRPGRDRLTRGGGQRVHPILVGLTEYHHQRKGWIARRSAVDP
jgi:hypothetical protein